VIIYTVFDGALSKYGEVWLLPMKLRSNAINAKLKRQQTRDVMRSDSERDCWTELTGD